MMDIAVSYNKYNFLGNEFLTWLWFMAENDTMNFDVPDFDNLTLEIGNRIVLEKDDNDTLSETLTIKGDDADLKEGKMALNKGSFVTEINILCRNDKILWQFNIKGESLNINSLKCHETNSDDKKDDFENAVLNKIYLNTKAIEIIDTLFKKFIKIRISEQWNIKLINDIKKWIKNK